MGALVILIRKCCNLKTGDTAGKNNETGAISIYSQVVGKFPVPWT